MGTLNLITGTASGKIGQFQYQTHGMKCVVRTKQPGGLTNDQAELVNKPILLNLSQAYHQWAKYLLGAYPSDWKKPQALWNYYTKCNQGIFTGTADYGAGYAVVKHGAAKQYTATYTVRPWEQTAAFQFDENPAALDNTAAVCLVRGLTSGPPEDWVVVRLAVTPDPQPVPCWSEEAGSGNVGYFLLDREGKLYGGMTVCEVKGDSPPEYFAPTPEEIAAKMRVYEEQAPDGWTIRLRLAFDTSFMPSWIDGKTIRYTARTAIQGHPSGTSWAENYSPTTTFLLPEYHLAATVDPVLSWVITEGGAEKSDAVPLKVSQILAPDGFFANTEATLFQEEDYPGEYKAELSLYTETVKDENFAMLFNLRFTGTGSVASHMAENPMFGPAEGFPAVWEGIPRVAVTPPCGTAQLVIGDHPNDSRYYYGVSFSVAYDEG
ncbi:MAG: hypothetical protein LBG27_13890 [Spirochaetaceae bacterium]|jgi:hypothetical protein|nr:hypothetical protein [Spirochaetaceae bacterium]